MEFYEIEPYNSPSIIYFLNRKSYHIKFLILRIYVQNLTYEKFEEFWKGIHYTKSQTNILWVLILDPLRKFQIRLKIKDYSKSCGYECFAWIRNNVFEKNTVVLSRNLLWASTSSLLCENARKPPNSKQSSQK